MSNNAKTTEKVAIVIICAAGCLAIEAVAYAFGWTKTLGEAALNWIAYSAVTSFIVTMLTKKKRNGTE